MHARVLSVRGGSGRLLSVSGRGLWIKERGGPWSVEEGTSPSCSSLHSDGESGGAVVGLMGRGPELLWPLPMLARAPSQFFLQINSIYVYSDPTECPAS